MTVATFRTTVMSKWNTGWTARKFINHARRHGLRATNQATANELDYLVGDKVSRSQREEFVHVG